MKKDIGQFLMKAAVLLKLGRNFVLLTKLIKEVQGLNEPNLICNFYVTSKIVFRIFRENSVCRRFHIKIH